MKVVPESTRTLLSVLCALALAGILISPAVPSPPTVVGKAIHASVASLVLAVLPPACALASLGLAVVCLVWEGMSLAGEVVARPVALPLRR